MVICIHGPTRGSQAAVHWRAFFFCLTWATYPLELGQAMDGVLDGVSGDDVWVVPGEIILAWFECELHVRFQLDDGVAAPLSPDDQHLHCVLAVARPHKLHVLRTHKGQITDMLQCSALWWCEHVKPFFFLTFLTVDLLFFFFQMVVWVNCVYFLGMFLHKHVPATVCLSMMNLQIPTSLFISASYC